MIEISSGLLVYIAVVWFLLGAYLVGGVVCYTMVIRMYADIAPATFKHKFLIFVLWPVLWAPIVCPRLLKRD